MEELIIRPLLERSDKIKYLIIPKHTAWNKGDLIVCKKLNKEQVMEEMNDRR
jgi:hypothetical protein